MRYKTFRTISIALLITCSVASCAVSSNPHQANEAQLTVADSNHIASREIWAKVREHFVLSHDTSQPEVQAQIRWFQQNPKYFNYIMQTCKPYIAYVYRQVRARHLPTELVLLPMLESDYDPYAYSTAGALGMWQLMPATADNYGLKRDWWYDGRRDIAASTRVALDFLSYLDSFFNGNWELAIAAYDSGPGTIQQAVLHNRNAGLSTSFWNLPLPEETRIYLPRLLALSAIIAHPHKYGMHLPDVLPAHLVQVTVDKQINLAHAANLANISLRKMHQFNPGYARGATGPNGPQKLLLPRHNAKALETNLANAPAEASIVPAILRRKPEEAQSRETWTHYVVREGDTLDKIALQHHVAEAELQRINDIRGSVIHPGQVLRIRETMIANVSHPAMQFTPREQLPSRMTTQTIAAKYRVVAGDTLSLIAERHHITTAELVSWNHLNPNRPIDVGQELQVTPPRVIPVKRQPEGPVTIPTNYVVKEGDTLGVIAERYHIAIAELVAANHLTSSIIRPGEKLVIPQLAKATPVIVEQTPIQPAVTNYVVQAGDTLGVIAERNHIATAELIAANHLTSSIIRPGEKLVIPHVPLAPARAIAQQAPPQSWIHYTVKEGDTLDKIANQFRITAADIRRWNTDANSKYLRPGETLALYVAK